MAGRLANRSGLAMIAVIAAVFWFSCLYTLPSPYFLDSYGYVIWVEEWRRGSDLPSDYRYANTLLYYWPVVLFGEYGLKVVGVAVTTALAALYWLQIRRDFSPATAFGAALIFFSAPPTVISATHLKEDLTSLLCFSASVLLVGQGTSWARIAAAGVAYGLSLMFKEVLIVAAPFLVAHVYLRASASTSLRECVDVHRLVSDAPRVLVFLTVAALAVLAVSPTRIGDFVIMASSPYMGQFLGLFSAQQKVGMRFWAEALLYLTPWYLFPVGWFAGEFKVRSLVQTLYLLSAIALLLFLANVSVVRMRHFVVVFYFLAPVLVDGIRSALSMAGAAMGYSSRTVWPALATLLICAAFSAANLAYVHPTIDYRLRYSPSREFFEPLSELPKDALLLGMDNCPIAQYRSGLRCENHLPDLDAAAARDHVGRLIAEVARRPIYLLPDFFGYDSQRHLRRAFDASFVQRPVHIGWWEPYHAMTYGESVADAIERLRKQSGCSLEGQESRPLTVSRSLTVDEVEVRLRCRDGSRSTKLIAYRGHVTFLKEYAVSRIKLR